MKKTREVTKRMLKQVAVFLVVLIFGLIAIARTTSANYFQPDNLFLNIFPEFAEQLMDIWSLGVTIVLLLQSVLLLTIGLVFLYKNFTELSHGKATFVLQVMLMGIVVALHVAAVMILFNAVSLAGGNSPVGVLVPLIIFVAGAVQTVLAIAFFGPHYNMMRNEG